MKPVIGVVSGVLREGPLKLERVYANREYITSVTKVGGTPILLPIVEEDDALQAYVGMCDGFLFTGGVDVSPMRYQEEPRPLLGETNLMLDDFQIQLFQKVLASKKPFMAICRGIQVLNVACGGTLHQDNSYANSKTLKHMQQTEVGEPSHTIQVEKGSRLCELLGEKVYINSYHHQSIEKLGEGLQIVARATDGIVEAVEIPGHRFALGVQWHPEVMFSKNETMRPIFDALVKASNPAE